VSKTEAIIAKVEEIVARAGVPEAIEPVEVQLVGGGNNRVLRIFIDKPGGVTHGDCQFISEYVGTVLDVEDVIPGGGYTLEVSSPGVERKLTTPRDFERHVDQKVKVVLKTPIDGNTVWEGKLTAFADGVLTVVPERKGQPLEPVSIPIANISRANLKFEW